VLKVVGFSGSLRRGSLNSAALRALTTLAPADLAIDIFDLSPIPLYNDDLRTNEGYPEGVQSFRDSLKAADGVLIATPEYNYSIPGVLKNAIDWASRPWGQDSFDHMPAAVIGASPGQIGTAVAQQSLRAVLSFCNARQMTAPEAYITARPGLFTDDGEVTDESTAAFLADFMQEFRVHTERVLTVLPRS
jgi:chromate reductase